MNHQVINIAAWTVAVSAGLAAAGPTVIFHDNFDSENGGVGELNYTGFANWTVSSGTVDLIGNGFHDFLPGNGLYVDLDGSTHDAGVLAQSTPMTFEAGKTYSLTFNIAGNQRGGQDSVHISLGVGLLLSHVITLSSSDPFELQTYTFVGDGTTGSIIFENSGGDNVGALLDEVTMSIIPLPSAAGLAGLGLLALASGRRRVDLA